MNPIDRLATLFEKFPGIGPRQARRFVQYLLMAQPGTRSELAELVRTLGSESSRCKSCFRWFALEHKGPSFVTKDGPLCNICASVQRDASFLFVVEKDADIENVERSGYRGSYFVLGGTVPLASEEPEKHVRIKELLKRIEQDASANPPERPGSSGRAGKLKEIILGLSATTEGDHTLGWLQEKILPIAKGLGFKLSSLGRGLSTGSELEYADPETIANALSSRQ